MTRTFTAITIALAVRALAGCADPPTGAAADPSGERIYYTEIDGTGAHSISSIAADGSDNRQIIRGADLVGAPLGDTMIFTSETILNLGYHLATTTGTDLGKLPFGKSTNGIRRSAHGRYLVLFDGNLPTEIASLDGKGIHDIGTRNWGCSGTSFSPDGRYMFTPTRDPDLTSDYPHDRIVIVTTETGAAREILLASSVNVSPYAEDASWSPDGSTIVFVTSVSGSLGGYSLQAIDPNRANPTPRLLTGGHVDWMIHMLAWRPDGTEIAFVTDNGIWSIRPDGTGLRLLVPDATIGSVTSLEWSPDGGELLINSQTWRHWSIRVLDVRSGTLRLVSDHGINARWAR